MNELLKELLPYLRGAACCQAQYPQAYLSQCRRTEAAFQALWDSFSAGQRTLYLQYEAQRNAQEGTEEEELLCQVFTLVRELYR